MTFLWFVNREDLFLRSKAKLVEVVYGQHFGCSKYVAIILTVESIGGSIISCSNNNAVQRLRNHFMKKMTWNNFSIIFETFCSVFELQREEREDHFIHFMPNDRIYCLCTVWYVVIRADSWVNWAYLNEQRNWISSN